MYVLVITPTTLDPCFPSDTDFADPLYGIAFSHNPQHQFRTALSTLIPGPANKLLIVDQIAGRPDQLQQIASVNLTFPATKVGWEPSQSVLGNSYAEGDGAAELLATTGDVLRIWDLAVDWSGERSGYVGGGARGGPQHVLNTRSVLTNVSQRLSAVYQLKDRVNPRRRVCRPSRPSRGIRLDPRASLLAR